MEHPRTVEWGGRTWYRQPESARRNDRVYYKSCAGGRPRYLHRSIYEAAHGAVPRGWHVHHRDGDPFNNDLANLEARDGRKHLAEHGEERWRDATAEARAASTAVARALAPVWHRSEEGRAWHREHARNVIERSRSERTCKECGARFAGVGKSLFCSLRCTSRWHARARRRSGVDNVSRVCGRCSGPFMVNKYSKQQNCCRVRAERG